MPEVVWQSSRFGNDELDLRRRRWSWIDADRRADPRGPLVLAVWCLMDMTVEREKGLAVSDPVGDGVTTCMDTIVPKINDTPWWRVRNENTGGVHLWHSSEILFNTRQVLQVIGWSFNRTVSRRR